MTEDSRAGVVGRFVGGMATLTASLAAVVLAAAILLLSGTALLRYGFGIAPAWADDLLRWSMPWLTFLGAVTLSARNQHITMDAVVGVLRPKARRVVDVFNGLLSTAAAGVLTWLTWEAVQSAQAFGQRSNSGVFAGWYGRLGMAVGATLMVIGFAYFTVQRLRGREVTAAPIAVTDAEGYEGVEVARPTTPVPPAGAVDTSLGEDGAR